jgi:hypothetical protein
MGFAAQTLDDAEPPAIERALVSLATEKLRRKGVPCVFVNRVGVPDTGFSTPTNAGWLVVAREDAVVSFSSGAPRVKAEVAAWLLETFEREVLLREERQAQDGSGTRSRAAAADARATPTPAPGAGGAPPERGGGDA